MKLVLRTSRQIRDDTNAILETVKSNFYSSNRLDKLSYTDPDKRELCFREIDTVVAQIKETCRSFNLDMDEILGLITLTVNGLVVAACTLKDKTSAEHKDFTHVEVYCTIGSDTTQGYLLEEAERISLAHDIKLMTIDVKLGDLKYHMEHGFFPISVDRIGMNSQAHGSKIIGMIDEAEEDFEKNHKDAHYRPASRDPQTFARKILNGVMGIERTSILEHHDPDSFHEWNEAIIKERSNELLRYGYGTKITLSKKLLSTSIVDYPVTYKKNTSVVSSLGDATSRFMELVRVELYHLEHNVEALRNLAELEEVVCRDAVVDGYIEDLRNESNGDNLIMTAEVSGKVIGLCILEFHDLGHPVHEPYMYIHLICAREHTGIGRRILAAAERFALQNGVSVLRLSALPRVVSWYQKLSFETGVIFRGNDSTKIKNKTERMDKVLPKVISEIDKMRKNISIDSVDATELAKAQTPVNDAVKEKFIEFLSDMYGKEKDGSKNEEVMDYAKQYDSLLVMHANDLNKDGFGLHEITETDDVGIHMSKSLRMNP